MDCHYFQNHICGSCTLLSGSAEFAHQLQMELLKQQLPDLTTHPLITAPATGSRIRARVAVMATDHKLQLGFRTDRSTFVPVDQCPLHHPAINRFLLHLKPLLMKFQIDPWSAETNRGELKHLIVTCSPHSEKLMLQCVLRSRESLDRLRHMWHQHQHTTLSDVKVLSANLQPLNSSSLTGAQDIGISDNQHLRMTWGTTTVYYGSQSFIQTNHHVAQHLYLTAARILQEHAAVRLLDVYCGSGAFSLVAAGERRRVSDIPSITDGPRRDGHHPGAMNSEPVELWIEGFDASQNAIDCAHHAAHQMQLPHAHYVCGDAAEAGKNWVQPFDAVICNPPRRGLDAAVRTLLQNLHAPLLLYSSCNPATLKRDIDQLSGHYRFTELFPFDMFPFTKHLEVLAIGHAT